MPGVKINTKEDAFRLFDEAVNALIGSNFIITQKPIKDLLRCLIFSDKLHAFVSDCVKGVNYEEELEKAVVETERGRCFFLPQSNKRIIALVTGLLSDFDDGKRTLTAFLHEFYPSGDNDIKFGIFCEEVLLPYRNAFRKSFLFDIDSSEDSPEAERCAAITEGVLEQAAAILSSLRTIFQGDNKLSSKSREDLFALTDGLYYSLETGDPRIIKAVWTGLKIALKGNKKAEQKFSDITEFLALYALL